MYLFMRIYISIMVITRDAKGIFGTYDVSIFVLVCSFYIYDEEINYINVGR